MRRLLLVEDEPLVAFATEHFLHDQGFDVVATVDRYPDAIAAIERGGIDLVLADVSLSGEGSGIDVARAAAAHGLPVLFVTGACPIEARELAAGCLAKPYVQRDLLAAIDAVGEQAAGRTPRRVPRGLSLFG